MSICDLSPKKLDISSQFQLTRRFAFKKKLSNDASSESQIENLRDFYRGFVLVGSALPSLFTLTRLSRPRQLVICRPEHMYSASILYNMYSASILYDMKDFSPAMT